MDNVWATLFTAAALAIGLYAREYAKAAMALRLGDTSVKLAGRLPPKIKTTADPFGTYLLPGLLLILVLAGNPILPPFAYAKPLAVNRNALRSGTKGLVAVSLAGPVLNLILAAVAGLALRAGLGSVGLPSVAIWVFLQVNIYLAVLHLMPIPGLDGGTLISLVLPPRPREVFVGLEPFLVLFVLVIFFLLGQLLLLPIVGALAGLVCEILAGPGNCFV